MAYTSPHTQPGSERNYIVNAKSASTSPEEVLPYPSVQMFHINSYKNPHHIKFTLLLGGKKYIHLKKEYALKCAILNAVPSLALVCHLQADFSSLPIFMTFIGPCIVILFL